MITTYPNLHDHGWKLGIHRAPTSYEHPWLVVTEERTLGAWTRDQARQLWRDA